MPSKKPCSGGTCARRRRCHLRPPASSLDGIVIGRRVKYEIYEFSIGNGMQFAAIIDARINYQIMLI